jgi:hypothetical protein
MLTAEQYEEICQARAEDAQLTNEQADALIDTIQRLDLHLAIMNGALQLSTDNLSVAASAIAENVMKACGRTDSKMKKKAAEMAATAVANCENSLHAYVTTAFVDAARLMGEDIEDFIGNIDEE